MTDDYISDALRGDHEAFLQLYDNFSARALRLSFSITRALPMAEDAVQEAFLRVYKKGRQCRRSEEFTAWFFRIVINESKRILARYPGEVELDDSYADPSFTGQSELSAAVSAAMDSLSQEHRVVLTLKFLLDHSEADIAKMIKKPIGTVKSRLHYAKKALAREMEPNEGGIYYER